MKRRLCLVLAAVCLLGFCGCADSNPDSSAPLTSTEVTAPSSDTLQHLAIAYSYDDTLNPFAAVTEVNLRLATLLYDSLTVMQEDFTPRLSLAAAIDSPDPTHLIVTLRESAVFSDGSPVKATDVATSFRQARDSKNYGALLQNVTAAQPNDKARQITFTLASADPNAAACLSFPVAKAASLTKEKAAAPMGGGLYILQADGNGHSLAANPHSGRPVQFGTVALRHLPNTDSLYYGLASGNISYYYNDLSGNSIPQVSGAHKAVDMPALFYLGVNDGRTATASPAVRQALSLLLDRPAIATAACSGWAEGSALPLHPRFGPMTALSLPSASRDLSGAAQRLTAAGYDGTKNKKLKLELIYHVNNAVRAAAAEQIRLQAEGGGVEIRLVPLSEKDYRTRLQNGQYDLYLAEIRLTANMSLQPLLAGGAASYGIHATGTAATAYRQYLAGQADLPAFLQAFAEDLPFIPLCWRRGFAAYDRRLTAVSLTAFDAYGGLVARH